MQFLHVDVGFLSGLSITPLSFEVNFPHNYNCGMQDFWHTQSSPHNWFDLMCMYSEQWCVAKVGGITHFLQITKGKCIVRTNASICIIRCWTNWVTQACKRGDVPCICHECLIFLQIPMASFIQIDSFFLYVLKLLNKFHTESTSPLYPSYSRKTEEALIGKGF